MKKIKEHLKVLCYEYLNCSYYGNPKKRLTLEDSNGKIFRATTANNAMCGYITPIEGVIYEFEYHYTKNGNAIIDYYYYNE